jgi:hypothetical protein
MKYQGRSQLPLRSSHHFPSKSILPFLNRCTKVQIPVLLPWSQGLAGSELVVWASGLDVPHRGVDAALVGHGHQRENVDRLRARA